MKIQKYTEDWDLLMQFFPEGWEEMAKNLGALKRQRKFKSAGNLLRLLLIHLADGCSMREAATRAKQGGLATVSDVALLKRLRLSSEWFRYMSIELLKRRGVKIDSPSWISQYQIKSVDASIIKEPGATGSEWRLHYSLNLFGLQADQFLLSRLNVGESFINFKVNKDDLFIGDRAYGRLKGLKHVIEYKGHFLTRLKNKAFKMFHQTGQEVVLLKELQDIAIGEVKEIQINAAAEKNESLSMRLCIIRKSDEEAEKSIKKALRDHQRKQRKVDSDTLALHRYIILGTSLPNSITAFQIAELYRIRWQIEIAFKRLKSILGLGHLPKTDEKSSKAWLHGKLFVALLTQAIVDEGRLFSPWGYPLQL